MMMILKLPVVFLRIPCEGATSMESPPRTDVILKRSLVQHFGFDRFPLA